MSTTITEKWMGVMQCWIDRRPEERSIEIEVPGYANFDGIIAALKREAARDFDWPISEIIFVRGRRVLGSPDTIDPDAAGSAMAGERFDGQN